MKLLDNLKDFELIGKSLLFKCKYLVLADLHLGYEEALSQQGIFLPRTQQQETIKELREIFKQTDKIGKLDKIIILGDLKHEFGTVSSQEWHDTLEILDIFEKNCKEIILIKGNHDTILEPIARQRKIKIRDFYILDSFCFLHGHKLFLECLDKKIKTLVLGHKHPAITLIKEAKSERYKAFLVGKFKGKDIIILPSFFPLVEGSDIIFEDTNLASNLKLNLREFQAYLLGDKIYNFGRLKDINKLE